MGQDAKGMVARGAVLFLDHGSNVRTVSRVTFTAEPGTVLATGYDGHSVVLSFPDSGELSFDEKDQEPVAVARWFAAEPSNAVAEKSAPKPAKEPAK